jgi:hypothetical protein
VVELEEVLLALLRRERRVPAGQLPEAPGEGYVLGGAEGLVAEEQDLVLQQGPPDSGDSCVVDVGKVGTLHLGADNGRQGMN